MTGPCQASDQRAAVWAAFGALLAVASAPVFSTVLPPLVDYPNHLARMHLLGEGGNAFYTVQWSALPDLAADLIVPSLTRLVGLGLAGKLFLVLSFALLAGGTLWLNRLATGKWRFWPLLAFLFLYNRSFLWGFLNYLFGVGLALCGLALWLAMERRAAARRIAVSVPVALACFFAHLAAFGIYALAVLAVEIGPALAELRAGRIALLGRRAAIAAAQFAGPAALLLAAARGEGGGGVGFGQIGRKVDLLFSVFDNYSRPFDIACFAALLLTATALVWRRRLRVDRRLGLAAVTVLVAYLLLPNQIFTGSGLDHRLPPAIFLLAVAATSLRSGTPRGEALLAGAIAVLFLGRMAVIELVWLRADTLYAAGLAAIDRLPIGARLAVAFPPSAVNAGDIPQLHAATLAVWRREGFVPTLFAQPTQHPIAVRPPYAALAERTSPTELWAAFVGDDADARKRVAPVLAAYDFIVFADRVPVELAARPCLRPLQSPPNLRLFALDPAKDCG